MFLIRAKAFQGITGICSKTELEGAALPVVQDFEFQEAFTGQIECYDPIPMPDGADSIAGGIASHSAE